MRALSIWQPHASLLVVPNPATGKPFKLYETRSWAAPSGMIGQRVAIHAAKNRSDLNGLFPLYGHDGRCDDEFAQALWMLNIRREEDLPMGAVIGTAILAACHRTETMANPGPFGDFADGRFAWEMADTRPLPMPVPFRGMQGFFDVPDELVRA